MSILKLIILHSLVKNLNMKIYLLSLAIKTLKKMKPKIVK